MKIIKYGNLKDCISDFYIQTFSMLFFPDDSVFGKNSTSENFIEIIVDAQGNQSENKINSGTDIDISVKICYNKIIEQKNIFCRLIVNDSENFKKDLIAEVGKTFYTTAYIITGIQPPWGVHTGIRPAKTAGKVFEDGGRTKSKAIDILTEKYLMNRKKAEIAVDVYVNAQDIINSTNENKNENQNEVSLYISIPFCPTKCRYCSFVSYSTPKLLKLIPKYMQALFQEIEHIGILIKEKGLILKTIYIGGGTPTTLDCETLNALLDKIEQCFDMGNITEYTVEAGRPDTIDKAKIDLFNKYKISRISINSQTLNDDVLINIGRCHTSKDFFDAYKIVRDSGIQNINTDCIVGLLGESESSMIATIKQLIELEPENITVHTLCIKKSAAMKTDNSKNSKNSEIYKPYAPEVNYALKEIYELLYKSGYMPYYMYKQKYAVGNLENTGFTKKNHACMYNIYMMDELQTIYGAGAGATTKIIYPDGRIERIINPKYPYEYLTTFFSEFSEKEL